MTHQGDKTDVTALVKYAHDIESERDRLREVNADLLAALKAILPFIPKSSAKEGGANRFAASVAAADQVRDAIAKAEQFVKEGDMKQFNKKTFGPVVSSKPDGTDMVAKCTWCYFLSNGVCTHVSPVRIVPDAESTPDWCEMREDMLRDAREMMDAKTAVLGD